MQRVDSNYDYSSVMTAITPELVKQAMIEEIIARKPDFDLSDPENIENIDFLVKRTMFSLHDFLSYMSESHDDDIEKIIEGTYE